MSPCGGTCTGGCSWLLSSPRDEAQLPDRWAGSPFPALPTGTSTLHSVKGDCPRMRAGAADRTDWGEGQAAPVAADRKPRGPACLLSVERLCYPPPTLTCRPRLGRWRLQTLTEMSRKSGSRIRHSPGPTQASGSLGGERGWHKRHPPGHVP